MKKTLTLLITSTILSSQAFADLGVYNCTLQGSKKTATLVYYPQSSDITWMPSDKLKTTKANATGRKLDTGEIEIQLFGFQDQADFLILPADAPKLPQQMKISTYHDNDDHAEDVQEFNCVK
jgi:uncharacterized protein YjdB